MPGPVVIWGAGGHGKVVADILVQSGYSIFGFIDEISPKLRPIPPFEASVLGGIKALSQILADGVRYSIVAIGDNTRRLAASEVLEKHGFNLISAIHPSAVVAADVSIGAGSVLAAGSVVNVSTVIGRCVIVNTRASVDHDCVVHDGAHIAPGASIAGHVEIGETAWVGIGATIVDRRRVGAGAIVGAGSLVIKDVPSKVVAVGTPARVIRNVD